MAGIYSQGGSAGHRYAGWLETVEAKNFQFGGKVFNGSPSAIYVGSNLVWAPWLLKDAAVRAILGAFGVDGKAVINATNAYLNQLAASDRDKATALADLINEDPMMVCSLGLQPQLTVLPAMPWRTIKSDGNAYIDTGFYVARLSDKFTDTMTLCFNDISRSHHHGFSPGRAGWWGVDSGKIVDTTVNASNYIGKVYEAKLEFNANTAKYYIDGEQKSTQTGGSTSSSGNIYLFCINNNGVQSQYRNQDDKVLRNDILDGNGDLVQRLIPYRDRTQGYGMLDIVGETFKPNAGSGQFTEEFGYMQNGQWVTWTPSTP